MGILTFIQRKLEGVLSFATFGKYRSVRAPVPARLCKFGHAVFAGNNLCNYGHHAT
jgi:hypothetical protein